MLIREINHVQILTVGGFVHDVSEEQWAMLKEEKKSGWIEFEDIYGGTIEMDPRKIDSIRHYTPEAGEKFREMNADMDSGGYREGND